MLVKSAPGMPEEFARMEDLFVDLHIVEEEKKPPGVILKDLKTYGDIVCITQVVEKDGRGEKKEVKRVLVRGPPGVGKSTALSKLAYDWACGIQDSLVSKFQLLFVITINEIKANTDLIGAIQDQLLPNVSRSSLEDYLQSNASSVAILFDGYDEATKHFHQSKNIKDMLSSKCLSEACVIVTTRPNQVGQFSQNYGPFLQVEILGFSDDERKEKYFQKFMETVQCNTSEFLNQLHKSSHLTQIASIPIILSMLCLLWAEDHNLPSTVTALYREVITHLAKHSYAKTQHQDLDMQQIHSRIDSVLDDIGKIAIDGSFEDRLVFTSSEFGQTYLDEGCKLGVVMKEKKRIGLNVTYNVTFLHKTFQEICGAHFWASLVEAEQDQFQKYLQNIHQGNIFEMEYLLRFACGLSLKAAEIILPHVVHIMHQHPQLRNHEGKVLNIYKNPCKQLPILLLFEAESNNAEIGHCINLHRQLKPLMKVMYIQSEIHISEVHIESNFQEVLSAYISLQESVKHKNKGDMYLWFDDVEEVYVDANVFKSPYLYFDHAFDANGPRRLHVYDTRYNSAKLVCAMSKVFILYIKEDNMIGNLLSNHFSGTSLSQLYLKNVKCEINRFSQFLSTIPYLNKCVIDDVSLHGDLSGAVSLARVLTVKELHIVGNSHPPCLWNYDMTSLLDVFMVNHFSDTTLSELNCKFCHYDANQCAQFLSCMSSLTKLTLFEVSLSGKLSSMIHLPAVKELCIVRSNEACQAILHGYGQAADVIRHDQERGHSNQELMAVNTCIPVERMEITGLSSVPDGLCNLTKAMKYMLHLRCLDLQGDFLLAGSLKPSDCEQIFDSLIDAAKYTHTCNHENKCTPGVGSENGLLLEELDLPFHEIGDSIGKFVIAYGYMPHLRCLTLNHVIMQAHHWEKLFDGFIEAGQTRNDSLVLEVLDISFNRIGKSIGKFAQAYRYMTQLRWLELRNTKLTPSHCAVLFDGFITAGKMLSQDESSSNAQDDVSSTLQSGLRIEKLDLSWTEIGESVEELLEALTYMPHLKKINLYECKLSEESRSRIDSALKTINDRFTIFWTPCTWEMH